MFTFMVFGDEETSTFAHTPFAGGFTGDTSELKVSSEWTLLPVPVHARSVRLSGHIVHNHSVNNQLNAPSDLSYECSTSYTHHSMTM